MNLTNNSYQLYIIKYVVMSMRLLLSKAERDFLQNLIKGKIDKYSYHYRKVLKKRILDKRKDLTEDLHLITLAEDKLQRL
jgi:hypothetical protein